MARSGTLAHKLKGHQAPDWRPRGSGLPRSARSMSASARGAIARIRVNRLNNARSRYVALCGEHGEQGYVWTRLPAPSDHGLAAWRQRRRVWLPLLTVWRPEKLRSAESSVVSPAGPRALGSRGRYPYWRSSPFGAIAGAGGTSRLQNRQTVASALISSAQNGHFRRPSSMIVRASRAGRSRFL